MDSKNLLPLKIKLLRTLKGMTQENLAEALDLHDKYITRLESVKPTFTFDMLDKLAEVFGVLPSYFFNPMLGCEEKPNDEKIDLITKKLYELSPKRLDDIYRIIFSLKDE